MEPTLVMDDLALQLQRNEDTLADQAIEMLDDTIESLEELVCVVSKGVRREAGG